MSGCFPGTIDAQNSAGDRGATRWNSRARAASVRAAVETLYLLVLVVAAGVGAQWIAARLHMPAILLLLFTGIALGRAGTGLLDPDLVFGELRGPFISLAVALVLFEGGLSLHLREARHVGPTLWKLIVSGRRAST